MADKYRQIKLSDYVGTFTTPREAFEFFKTYVSLVRGDWLEVREKIMKRALRYAICLANSLRPLPTYIPMHT